jgi:hypothetical protein
MLDGKITAKNFYVVIIESFENLIRNFQVEKFKF